MTRQEILNTPEIVDFMIDKSVMVDSKMKLHKRLEELCKLAIKALEQEDMLDKIRAEIEQITDTMGVSYNQYVSKIDVLQIIDKYKAESEDKE